jgi:hypothetical protein
VTNGPDVDVRLRPLELRLRHFFVLLDYLVLVKAVLVFSVVPRPTVSMTRQGYSDQY